VLYSITGITWSSHDIKNDDDKEHSWKGHAAIGTYYKWKYKADKNLVTCTALKWGKVVSTNPSPLNQLQKDDNYLQ
jgi:hypothetical protein